MILRNRRKKCLSGESFSVGAFKILGHNTKILLYITQEMQHSLETCDNAMWMEKVFSSAFEVTLKFCLRIFQPNPGGVGLYLSALGVHTPCSSSARSPEQCDPHRELSRILS